VLLTRVLIERLHRHGWDFFQQSRQILLNMTQTRSQVIEHGLPVIEVPDRLLDAISRLAGQMSDLLSSFWRAWRRNSSYLHPTADQSILPREPIRIAASASGVSQAERLIAVLIAPGPIAFTRIRCGASSWAMLFINNITPPFDGA
jgi:hypothetical protein